MDERVAFGGGAARDRSRSRSGAFEQSFLSHVPFDPASANVIDAETAGALRALYGWSPQTPLTDRATTDRPALAVAGDASFGSSNFSLFSAWKGSAADQTLWWSQLIGQEWSPSHPSVMLKRLNCLTEYGWIVWGCLV